MSDKILICAIECDGISVVLTLEAYLLVKNHFDRQFFR